MPPRTITCDMCGETVTKRSTLSLAPFGAGDGRACREHEELRALIEAYKANEKQSKAERDANSAIQIMFLIAIVRVKHTLYGIPLKVIYWQLRKNGVVADVLLAVREGIEHTGAQMSVGEITQSLAMNAELEKSVRDAEHRRGMN